MSVILGTMGFELGKKPFVPLPCPLLPMLEENGSEPGQKEQGYGRWVAV